MIHKTSLNKSIVSRFVMANMLEWTISITLFIINQINYCDF